ncbi:MAG: hypothetical protein HYY24_12405 [Verrucomicrobia bacterium]|nr:hypothetical protein [Verrucomicrobiota bacterium]
MKTQQRIHSLFSPWLGVALVWAALLINAWSQTQIELTPRGSYSEGFSNPEALGWDVQTLARDVQVVGRHAYVAVGTYGGWKGALLVIEVSDSTQPRRVAVYQTLSSVAELQVVGNQVYLAASGDVWGVASGLQIIGVRDPANPALTGELVLGKEVGTVHAVRVVGDYAYVAGDWYLVVIDVRDPARPRRIGRLRTQVASGLDVVGKYAYVGDRSGLFVVDVSNPAAPTRLGSFPIEHAEYPHVKSLGNYVFVSTTLRDSNGNLPTRGFDVIDVSDASQPQRVGGYDIRGVGTDFLVIGSYAFLQGYVWDGQDLFGAHLAVFDVSSPPAPVLLGTFDMPGLGGIRFDAVGKTLYVVGGDEGLFIFDIGFPPGSFLNPPLRSGDKLSLSWNGGAGIKLQTTPSLTAPSWQDVPGTDGASSIESPLTDPSAFFRLVKP